MKYVGHMKGSFKDRQTGREVNFLKLYVVYPREGVVGMKAEELKVDYRLAPDLDKLQPDQEIDVYFDRYQRVNYINLVK